MVHSGYIFTSSTRRYRLNTVLPALALLLSSFLNTGCQGQAPGYHISATLRGCNSGDSIMLARYEGAKTIFMDTLPCGSGNAVFSGSLPLKPGMYALLPGSWGKIDLLISDSLNQRISLSADARQLFSTLTFEDSPENRDYTAFQRLLRQQSAFRGRLYDNQHNPDSVNRLSKMLRQLNGELVSLSGQLQEQHTGKLLSLFLRILKEPTAPEPSIPLMVTDRDRFLQEYYYNYRKDHFWDGVDFSDRRLIAMPVYEEKLRYYFQQLVEPVPEAAGQAIDNLLEKADNQEDVYRFTAYSLFKLYRESPMPTLIPVTLHIADNFILNREERWKGDPRFAEVSQKVAKARLNSIGTVATDLKLVRNSGEVVRLSEIKARTTILYFFNPDCESCNPITEKLLPLYRRVKNQGVEVFAVYLDTKTEIWNAYIASKKLDWINVYDPSGEVGIESKYDIYAIPMIYLLDQDKKIIAKDVLVEEVEDYLRE